MLNASIGLHVGALDLDLDLTVDDGEVVALLGPNGAGKTTALQAIAGLRAIERGTVSIDDVVFDDPRAGVFVPTADRPIGYVFQDLLLFPRMSALDNVAFGLRARGRSKATANGDAQGWLDRLGIGALASSKPQSLSGGEAQRVALARSLATEPRVLLLDEPLAALDASTRIHVRTELRRHLATFAGARLLVTHDPIDALVLADRIVILEAGRVTQAGTPAEVTARPRSRYVAELVGMNLLHGIATGERTLRLESGAALTVADALPGPSVAVTIRPQALTLHRRQPEGSARNTWVTTVEDLESTGDRVRVSLGQPIAVTAEVTPAAVADLELGRGAPVWVSVKAVDITTFEQ